ncbi:hypothetical protein EVA_17336 [gut metagenome]|uniref:Uncharacterized protein n=1 Tax=gut metagenome TaxID=749906 RepID=J9FI63_9ZZZZ
MQSKGIDKQHEAECLAVIEHLAVYLQVQTAYEYAKEEHKGNTQRNATKSDLAQPQTDATDEGNDDDGLNTRLDVEKGTKPIHIFIHCLSLQNYGFPINWQNRPTFICTEKEFS